MLPKLHTIKTTITSVLQPHHTVNSFLRFHLHISLLNFVQHSNLLKFLQMINQTIVQLLYETLQLILQHYLKEILDKSKLQLQMKNPNIIKSMILTL